MSAFVKTINGDGYVNLDLVARASGDRQVTCYAADGTILGRVGAYDLPRPAPVIADTTGSFLLTFMGSDGEGFFCERAPIIGWFIEDMCPVPITAADTINESSGSVIVCIELRDGGKPYTWEFPCDRRCDTFAEAEQHAHAALSRLAEAGR